MAKLAIINIEGKECKIAIPDNRPCDQLVKVRGTDVPCPVCQRLFSEHTWKEFDHLGDRFPRLLEQKCREGAKKKRK